MPNDPCLFQRWVEIDSCLLALRCDFRELGKYIWNLDFGRSEFTLEDGTPFGCFFRNHHIWLAVAHVCLSEFCCPSWLVETHRKLDAAVFAAYGWLVTLTDAEVLERLLALNHERAAASQG
jgi:hypothetical protein